MCVWKFNDVEFYKGWSHPSGSGLLYYWCHDLSMQKSRDYSTSIITREQYEAALAETKEQKMKWKYIKGSEKDFVGAPEWATIKGETGRLQAWEGCGKYLYINSNLENRVFTGEFMGWGWDEPAILIAQREPVAEWDGSTYELPPIGLEVEIAASTKYLHIGHPEGSVVKIYSHFTDDRGVKLAAFVDKAGKVGGVCSSKCFRPHRTEADKKRDDANPNLCHKSPSHLGRS